MKKTDAWDLISKNILQLRVSHHNEALQKDVSETNRQQLRGIDQQWQTTKKRQK
jgi:hypothetical protein